MTRADRYRRRATTIHRIAPWMAFGALLLAIFDAAAGRMLETAIDAGAGLALIVAGLLLPAIYERRAVSAENELDRPPKTG